MNTPKEKQERELTDAEKVAATKRNLRLINTVGRLSRQQHRGLIPDALYNRQIEKLLRDHGFIK